MGLCSVDPAAARTMTDPFSVAGTAVGITSLGVQVCQGLFRYYSHFRGYHDDIDGLLNNIEGRRGIFKALVLVKQKIETDNHEPSEQLQVALLACEAALKSLDTKLKRCTEAKVPMAMLDRGKAAKNRFLWPFKKDTVMGMQAMLDKLQANLHLALLILGT